MSNPYGSFMVSTNIFIPDEDRQQRTKLIEYMREHAEAINRREVATYDSQPSSTGQQWPPLSGQNVQRRRVPLRIVVPITIDSAAAPNTNSFAHGLTPAGYTFTHIAGVIGNGSSSWIPLPFPGTDQTLVQVDATNVVISNETSTFNSFTGYVVLEYIPV